MAKKSEVRGSVLRMRSRRCRLWVGLEEACRCAIVLLWARSKPCHPSRMFLMLTELQGKHLEEVDRGQSAQKPRDWCWVRDLSASQKVRVSLGMPDKLRRRQLKVR